MLPQEPEFGFIYLITNLLNGKQYVGQTIHAIAKRFRGHNYAASNSRSSRTPIVRAIRKYGFSSFQISELETVPRERLDEREIFWIKEKGSMCPNGYNATTGGVSFSFAPPIQETINKDRVGVLHTLEWNEKIRRTLTGRTRPPEVVEKMRDSMLARGSRQSPEFCKSVIAQNLETLEEHTFHSCWACAKHFDVRSSVVDQNLRRNSKSFKKIWKLRYG